MDRSRRTSLLAWGGVVSGMAILFWFVPPFHVLKLKASREQSAATEFNASAFVDRLWSGSLTRAAEHATDARTLVAAIHQDVKAAREKYGHSAQLGSSYFYFVTGEGRIAAVDRGGVSLVLSAVGSEPDVVLETGNIFGNAIRDGTGVVNVSDFPNSQDFNAISSEMNRRVEERILPGLRSAAVGKTIHFAGCAEIADESTDLHPLHVVALSAEIR